MWNALSRVDVVRRRAKKNFTTYYGPQNNQTEFHFNEIYLTNTMINHISSTKYNYMPKVFLNVL